MLDIKQETTTRHSIRMEVLRKHLIDALNQELKADGSRVRIPNDADVIVAVPGGGDWSNTELDVGVDHPLIIKWSEVEEG
jgi:hypothetical protein